MTAAPGMVKSVGTGATDEIWARRSLQRKWQQKFAGTETRGWSLTGAQGTTVSPPHPHTLAHRVQLALAGCSLNGDVSVWQTMKRYAGGDVSPQPQPPLCELEARKGGTPCVRVEEQYAPSSGRLGLRVPIVQQEGVRESEEPLVPFGVRRALGNHLIHKHGNTLRRVLGAMELGHAPHSGHGMHVDCTWATALTRAKHNSRKQRVASGDVYSRALGRRSERCARVRECVCVGGG